MHLNPLPAEDFDREHADVVAWSERGVSVSINENDIFGERKLKRRSEKDEKLTRHEPKRGDDQVSRRDLEELRPRRALAAIEPDLLEDDVLIEVDPVEAALQACS